MPRGIIGAIVAIVVVVIIAAGSWYTVDQTERGVKLRYGAIIGTAQPGLGFKIPLIDSVEKVSVKTITYCVGQDELLLLRPAARRPQDQRHLARSAGKGGGSLLQNSGGSTPRSTRWSAPPSTSRSRSCSAATRR